MKAGSTARQHGVTLIESLVVLSVIGVIVGSTAPAISRMADLRRLQGAAAQLETELHYARSLAVARNQSVRFSFQQTASSSCYVIHTGTANGCQCNGSSTGCNAGAEAIRTQRFDADSRLRATSNSASFLFDPAKGTVTPTATIEVRGAEDRALRLVVNIMGRVRVCSPNGVEGYKAC